MMDWIEIALFTMVHVVIAMVILCLMYIGPRSLDGCCKKCGYNLTGNVSGICPECGEQICDDA